MDWQVKDRISALRDFLAGRSSEARAAEVGDKATRQVVAEELLAVMLGTDLSDSEGISLEQQPKRAHQAEQERARKVFMDHGYFDEAVRDLRGAISPQQRAAAARALGVVGSNRVTPHLIAAMFDDDPEVRNAAEAALAQMGGPTASNIPANARLGDDPGSEKSKVVEELSPAQKTSVSGAASQESGEPDQSARDAVGVSNEYEALSPKSPVHDHSAHVPSMIETASEKSGVDEFEIRIQQATQRMFQRESSQETGEVSQEMFQRATIDDATASRVEEQLFLEERAIREKMKQLERQSFDAGAVRAELEKEAVFSVERETRLRAEAAIRQREEEELRKRADEEAEHRRSQERAAVTAEQLARTQAEAEAQRLAEEEARMRLETFSLQKAAEELVWRRIGVETARREATEAARRAEAKRSREEVEKRYNAELTRLRNEEEALRAAMEEAALRRAEVENAHQDAKAEIERLTKERVQLAAAEAARRAETRRIREAEEKSRADHEQLRMELEGLRLVAQEVATRRAELEAARKKADEEAERLLETQARMRAEEEASARAESERVQLEAEIHERVKTEQRLLEEARRRAQEEQQRLEDEARRSAEHEKQRRAELELLQKNAQIVAQQRAEEEKQIRSQADSLRIADAEARKRIEEAEARRRKSEDVYRLVAEKVQRVEAEAHLRAVQEEQILAKLEAVRRSAAVEAQARADQEKRIKEEIELFRKLEDVERPRLEVAALQRTQAQELSQQQRDRAQADEETRGRADEQLDVVDAQLRASADEESANLHRLDTPDEPQHPVANLEPALTDEIREKGAISVEDGSAPGATATIQTYLNSVDPYKRAAAVAELARSNAKDAFDLIAKCFDDHSPHVRNAAARALLKLEPTRTVDLFNRALETGSEQRRRNIGSAIADSGLATEAIDNLVSENREATFNALSILFVMAKTGEVQPLVQAIQEHPNGEISEAAIKLLTLSGQSEIANAALKRRVNGSAGQ